MCLLVHLHAYIAITCFKACLEGVLLKAAGLTTSGPMERPTSIFNCRNAGMPSCSWTEDKSKVCVGQDRRGQYFPNMPALNLSNLTGTAGIIWDCAVQGSYVGFGVGGYLGVGTSEILDGILLRWAIERYPALHQGPTSP